MSDWVRDDITRVHASLKTMTGRKSALTERLLGTDDPMSDSERDATKKHLRVVQMEIRNLQDEMMELRTMMK